MRYRLALLFPILFIAACKGPDTTLRVEKGWIAEIPPMIRVTAGYMTIHNDGDRPRHLVGASSERAASVEIHRSVVEEEIAKMLHQKEVTIPAKGSVRFDNASGYHLMFYGVTGLKAGEQVPVELEFRDGSTLKALFTVVDRRKLP
ncbi:MAG: hypothetical protein Kow006_22270 [Gammaproteobacteria bacterium]